MTLCAAWSRVQGQQLVVATDSRITGGYTYDFGTKLVVFNRGDCVLCWEGSTGYTYSFVVHAKSDVDWSDVLSSDGADLVGVAQRVRDIFNHIWEAALKDKGSQLKGEEFSFIFGGYSSYRQRVMAWCLGHSPDRTEIIATPLDLTQPYFAGSGADAARQCLRKSPKQSPFAILRSVIDDPEVHDVGGIPQAVTVDRQGVQVVGVVKDGNRFLFGRAGQQQRTQAESAILGLSCR